MLAVRPEGTLKSPLSKHLSPSDTEGLLGETRARPGDLLLVSACSLHTVVGHKAWGFVQLTLVLLVLGSAIEPGGGAGVSCRTRREERGWG